MLTPPNSPQKKAEGGGKRGKKEKKNLCKYGSHCSAKNCKFHHPYGSKARPMDSAAAAKSSASPISIEPLAEKSPSTSSPVPTMTSCRESDKVNDPLPLHSGQGVSKKSIKSVDAVCKYDGFCNRPKCKFTHLKGVSALGPEVVVVSS
jgi:hypothetical protein